MPTLMERALQSDSKAYADLSALPPVGARVTVDGDYYGEGTVTGHETNLNGTRLVLVKMDPDPNNPTVTDFTGWEESEIESYKRNADYIPGFYNHEVTVIA